MKHARGSVSLLGLALLAPACAMRSTGGEEFPYLEDREYRRAELERSLESRDNGYARLRLARYATGLPDDWDTLPEWNPRVTPVEEGDIGAPLPAALDHGRAVVISGEARQGSHDALLAVGQEAFERYPVQLLPAAQLALSSPELLARYGFWRDTNQGVGGLVRAEMADGSLALAMTCSTCHEERGDLQIVPGAPNAELDLGRLAVDAGAASGQDAMLLWGPGRLDVSSASGLEPVKIPDLRAVRFVKNLQTDATVVQNNVTSLAIRIETLIIKSHNQVLRPPREISLGLAVYLWSLSDDLPLRSPASEDELRGEQSFAATCAGCHVPPGYAGSPVTIETVGTDPIAGRSEERGTGQYRVPSLRGVSTRGPLLHDGSLRGLEPMFDPTRVTDGYANGRLGPGPVQGHRFGLDLGAADRAALVAFVRTL
jgi:mono/diheme cytochrome c family protein